MTKFYILIMSNGPSWTFGVAKTMDELYSQLDKTHENYLIALKATNDPLAERKEMDIKTLFDSVKTVLKIVELKIKTGQLYHHQAGHLTPEFILISGEV